MKKLSKSIFIFTVLFFTSCERFLVGDVVVVDSNFPGSSSYFNYVVVNDHIILKGKINNEFFTGDVFKSSTVQKVEMARYPNISKKDIKRRNIFAYTKMYGDKGSVVECFIKQNSKRKFWKGGLARCYFQDGRVFHIELKKVGEDVYRR